MKTVSPTGNGTLLETVFMGFMSDTKATLGGNRTEVVYPFIRTRTLTAAAAAAGVDILANAEAPDGCAPFVTGWQVDVGGATAWTDATATKVGLYDKAGSPVTFFEIAKAGLTANATLFPGMANHTYGAGVRGNVGGTADYGLIFKADANFANGSNIKVTVYGYYRKTVQV
jgi:hypothetical protein